MTREIALHCMKSYSELHSDLCELCPIYGETGSDHCFEDALQYVIGMLERDLSSELDKNSKKLEKNFGESDCISREQALRELKESAEHHANDSREEVLLRRDRDIIRALPAVTAIRPKGHWINKHRFVESWSCSAECSSCHKRSNGYIHDNGYGLESTYDDFCPKCGSDNREVKE